MALHEQPFDEREQRYFLAEIVKASSIPPAELLNFIQAKDIAPNWMDMAFPTGRTPTDCERVFEALKRISVGPQAPLQPQSLEHQTPASRAGKRQSQPSEAPNSVTDRFLHPQRLNFPPVNVTRDQTPFQAPPTAPATSTEERPAKKRGRPSKAEYEQRVREAEQRGEVYPPPRKRKTPRASLEEASGEGIITPGRPEDDTAAGGSVGKKKAKSKATAQTAPHTFNSAVEGGPAPVTTSSEPNRMEIDSEPKPERRTVSETQTTDFPAQASLLSRMREYETPAEADTTQSTSTLKGDYSMPRTQRQTEDVIPATPDPQTREAPAESDIAARPETTVSETKKV